MLLFLPLSEPRTGWLVGWAHNTVLLVATVVPGQTRETLDSRLCNTDGRVLGYASNGNIELLDSPPPAEGLTTVLYKRPDPRKMRFFTVDPLPLIDTELTSSPEVKHTETLLPQETLCFGGGNIRSILARLNTSHTIKQIALGNPVPSSSPPSPTPAPIPHIRSPTNSIPRSIWSFLTTRSCFFRQFSTRHALISHLLSHPHKSRLREPTCDPRATVQYLSFYNSIWLILNDTILGSSYGLYLIDQRQFLSSSLISTIQENGIDTTLRHLHFLDNWPYGLKLNTELSAFLYTFLTSLTSLWSQIIIASQPLIPHLILLIGLSGLGGLSFLLSAASDILSLSTANIYISYTLMCRAYSVHLSALYSLWNLFRGKRWNVLRNRVDSWSYDVDQLFLGSMLFTLLTFLFPTIGAYYLLFALIRLAIILTQAVIDILLAFLNSFPLGALMLRLKDSDRLPGGVYFVPVSDKQRPGQTFRLKNQPIALGQIFHRHIELWTRLAKHYNPLRLFLYLLRGRFLDKIPRDRM